MMRLIVYVAMVAALATAAVWLANDPGAVSLVWHGWRVNTSVGILVTAMIAAMIVIFLVLRLVALLGGTVRAFAAAQRERRLKRGLTSLGDGFAAVQAGQGPAARKLAKEAASLLHNNSAVLMLRKDAAVLSGDGREVQAAAQAMLARPETELAGLRTLADKALAEGDVMGALTHARNALAHRDAPPWALHMVMDGEIVMERWGEALAALDTKLGRETFAAVEYRRLKSRLLTRQAQAYLRGGDAAAAANAARKAMDADDANYNAVAVFAKAMAAQGKGRKAAGAVERAWASAPHVELLAAYKALIPGESTLDWAQRVDNLAKAAPNHPESRLAVAIASLDAALWGQARNRLQGLTGEDTAPEIRARAAHILAEVETRERGDSDSAAEWLKVALAVRPKTPGAAAPRSAAELLAQA
jgi:HemY protein